MKIFPQKTLIEILEDNKATINFELGEGGYSTYYAHIGFEKSKVTLNIFDDEGGYYGDAEEAMPFEWIEKIYKTVKQ